MILRNAALANFTAGTKLKKNITATAMTSQIAICRIVKLVTTGLGTSIISVALTPATVRVDTRLYD